MNSAVQSPVSDTELRAMRDAVYPATSEKTIQTDESWEQLKGKWRDDEAWLTEEYNKLKARCEITK